MRLFTCPCDGQLLYFENTRCEACGEDLGYLPDENRLTVVRAEGDALTAEGTGGRWRFCANAAHAACNWLVPADSEEAFCACCCHNRTIPDLSIPENLSLWQRAQATQHRLFYTILRLDLPRPTQAENPETGLAFDVLADDAMPPGQSVITGHDSGLITLALAEADDAERERRRSAMGEPYRTLLGHYRHEVGHYYWDRLVRDAGKIDACRAVFGDESQDYGQALQRHYANGAPPDWPTNFVSSYASAHPWEDFAETWAHYLHMIDTVEMARAFGMGLAPKADESGQLAGDIDVNPYREPTLDPILEAWVPLTVAVNSLNRCMGAADAYPFVLTGPVKEKLRFIHALVRGG